MAISPGTPTCPLCGGPPDYRGWIPGYFRTLGVECPRCGRFKITQDAIDVMKEDQKALLSAYCRRLPEGAELPAILSSTIEQLIRTLPKYTPLEKLDNLLAAISHQFFGRRVVRPDGRCSSAFSSARCRRGTSPAVLETIASWSEVVPTEGQGLTAWAGHTFACGYFSLTSEKIARRFSAPQGEGTKLRIDLREQLRVGVTSRQ